MPGQKQNIALALRILSDTLWYMSYQDKLKATATYCLYARKSSESDERQAMSIDGQLSEMKDLARREKLQVVETITESHSAKESGQRPEFNKLLQGLIDARYNAILTWAPDRLSRNAGDLGRIVDLMDQKRLFMIRTYSQVFSNNPNEKFLLMILCSQAKLENDNRGINVKRGLKNKCEIGIRPCLAPIGYKNVLKGNRISTVAVDEEKAPVIKEIFHKVANQGYSGRMIKRWLDDMDFRTKYGCHMCLGRIYKTLTNSFYFGEFKFGETTFKGTHEPLITKALFEKVQVQLQVVPRQWNKQQFPFKKLCVCGSCGGNVTAEIKYRRTKYGHVHTHIYYHCNRIKHYDCKEPYITEQELIKQLIAYLPDLKLNTQFLMNEFDVEIKRLEHMRSSVIGSSGASNYEVTPHNTITPIPVRKTETTDDMLREYLLHIFQYGTPEERIKIIKGISTKFTLSQRRLEILQ